MMMTKMPPLTTVPLLVLGRTHPWFAVPLASCAFGCGVSTALLQVHRPPAKQDAFKTRGRGAPGKGFLEMGVILSWILFCALLTWIGIWMQR